MILEFKKTKNKQKGVYSSALVVWRGGGAKKKGARMEGGGSRDFP